MFPNPHIPHTEMLVATAPALFRAHDQLYPSHFLSVVFMLARRTTSTPTAWTCIVVSADLGLHQDGALFGDNFSRLDNASGDGVLGFTTDRVNSYQREGVIERFPM